MQAGQTWRNAHRIVFIVVAAAVVLAHRTGATLPLPFVWTSTAIIILLIGVPHGAFDVALARSRWRIEDGWQLTNFLAGYVTLAAVVIVVWWATPHIALPLFLAVSAYHFAGDWRDAIPNRSLRAVVGTALITAPAVLHRNGVIEIFVWLVPLDVATSNADTMAVLAAPAMLASLGVIAAQVRCNRLAGLEITAVLALSLLTTPMVFFVTYFCALHAIRHMQTAFHELGSHSVVSFMRLSLPYAPIAVVGMVVGSAFFAASAPGAALLGAVILGLAALTAPHMLLVELRAPRLAAET